MNTPAFKSLNIAVLTISDTRGEDQDISGKLLVEKLTTAGHRNIEKAIVRDDKYDIRAALSRWIADPRALAGVANATYIFVMPGSSSACRTAWDKLVSEQLDNRTRPCNLVMLMPRLKEV